uniref:Uncharacterized protein n=1 Tax=Hippocampus comes TaxID=109280 RepID=A0A3Q2Y7G2_HIPCM
FSLRERRGTRRSTWQCGQGRKLGQDSSSVGCPSDPQVLQSRNYSICMQAIKKNQILNMSPLKHCIIFTSTCCSKSNTIPSMYYVIHASQISEPSVISLPEAFIQFHWQVQSRGSWKWYTTLVALRVQ